jgi:CRISPR system Cascade subunit CasA
VGFNDTGNADPMLGYRIDEKKGKLPIQFREKGLWRDFDSLLPDGKGAGENRLAPGVIDHAIALTRHQRDRFPKSILVLGQSNDKAKIEFWRMEQFVLPEAVTGERNIRAEVRSMLAKAEDTQKALWLTCRSYARDVLSRGTREPDGKDVRNFIDQLPAIGSYWSTLESQFHQLLRDYSVERDPDDIRLWWLKVLRRTLKSSWDQTQEVASAGDAWSIRALVKAEAPVRNKIRELDEEIAKLKPQTEVA